MAPPTQDPPPNSRFFVMPAPLFRPKGNGKVIPLPHPSSCPHTDSILSEAPVQPPSGRFEEMWEAFFSGPAFKTYTYSLFFFLFCLAPLVFVHFLLFIGVSSLIRAHPFPPTPPPLFMRLFSVCPTFPQGFLEGSEALGALSPCSGRIIQERRSYPHFCVSSGRFSSPAPLRFPLNFLDRGHASWRVFSFRPLT